MKKNYFLSCCFTVATLAGVAQSDRSIAVSPATTAAARQSLELLNQRPAPVAFKSAVSCDSLTVDTLAGNGFQGNMFDITVVNTITLETFSMDVDNGTGVNVAIFYRTGTFVGSETSAAGWTFLDSAQVNATTGVLSKVPVNLNLVLAPGTYGFYVTVTAAGAGNSYSNGTAVGNVYASDANIQVKEGNGGAYPFSVTNSPRIFNGQVFYCVGSAGIDEENAASFSIYPNPSNGNVSVDLAKVHGAATLNIVNALGETVMAEQVNGGSTVSLNTETYAKGIYFLKVTTAAGTANQKLIIK